MSQPQAGQDHFAGTHGDTVEDVHDFLDEMVEAMEIVEGRGRVLDVGAGDGYLVKYYEGRYEGVDSNPMAAHVQQGEASNYMMRRPPEIYELVIFCHVLEHVKNPAGLLGEAYRLLADGGRVAVAVPHASAPWAWEYADHFYMWEKFTMARMLNRAGFLVDYVETPTLRRDCIELWMVGSKDGAAVAIIVNGRKIETKRKRLSFADLAQLAFPGIKDAAAKGLTMTYHGGPSGYGILLPGDSMFVEAKTKVNCTHTGRT